MNCKQMIEAHLMVNGYEGLFNQNVPCGCELSDLVPCDGEIADCEAGYKHFDPRQQCKERWAIFLCKETPEESDWDEIDY
jgi:hypothetical protein